MSRPSRRRRSQWPINPKPESTGNVSARMDTAQHSSDEAPTSRRISGTHIVLAIGIGFALLTAVSGIVGAALDWHDDSPESREVFGNIPGSLELAFYVVLVVLILAGAVQFANRMKNWERGKPDNRATTPKNVKRRLEDFRAGVYMQTLLREPAAGIMHSLIYFSFLILLAVTTTLEIDHQLPESAKFLHGGVYKGFAAVGDIAGRDVRRRRAVGHRAALRPAPACGPTASASSPSPSTRSSSARSSPSRVTGFVTEMFRIALAGRPDSRSGRSSATRCRSSSRNADHLAGWHQACGSPTCSRSVAFLIILPTTMLRHMFTSPLNMYLQRQEPAQGRDEAHAEPDGDLARDVRRVNHRGLHVEAAARHRRLHHVRPLHARVPRARHGQAARPARDRAQGRRGHGGHRQPRRSARPIGTDPEITVGANWRVRADHARRGVGLHHVQGVRRDLPGQHRDPRQDPRHAALPVAHGVQLPHRARHRVPRRWRTRAIRGALAQGERADWANDLEGIDDHRRHVTARGRVPLLGRLRRQLRRQEQEGHARDGAS